MKENGLDKHYTDMGIEPIEYTYSNKLDPYQHTVIKYVTRWRAKGKLRDLNAAALLLDKYIKVVEREEGINKLPGVNEVLDIVVQNSLYWKAQSTLIEKLKHSGHKYEAVYAVSRGGLTPAHFIAEALGIKDVSTEWQNLHPNCKILVVEDIIDSGKSATELSHIMHNRDVTFATVFQRDDSSFEASYVGIYVAHSNYVYMPWESRDEQK